MKTILIIAAIIFFGISSNANAYRYLACSDPVQTSYVCCMLPKKNEVSWVIKSQCQSPLSTTCTSATTIEGGSTPKMSSCVFSN